MQSEKFIAHVDMDAFFASVEQRDNPDFRGRPVVVGADPKNGIGRGVVSTCSYEARKYGICSAMPISIAYRKCPDAIFLPVDMEKYSRVSQEIHEILYTFTPDIEPVSIDEAFLDISSTYKLFGSAYDVGVLIKSRIKKETGLTASVGIAPNKMAAKIASDFKKPDGLVEIKRENLLDFLWPLDVSKLWGIGKKAQSVLNESGIITIGDLAKTDARVIIKLFGKNGMSFWHLANGIDDRQIEAEREAKSISNEITFEEDTSDKVEIISALISLCEKVSQRLRQEGLKARTITLKLRFEDFQTFTKSITLFSPTNFFDIISKEIKQLFYGFKYGKRLVRLVGVKASNFCPSDLKESLFEDKEDAKREHVHKAIDQIKAKFGSGSISRAAKL